MKNRLTIIITKQKTKKNTRSKAQICTKLSGIRGAATIISTSRLEIRSSSWGCQLTNIRNDTYCRMSKGNVLHSSVFSNNLCHVNSVQVANVSDVVADSASAQWRQKWYFVAEAHQRTRAHTHTHARTRTHTHQTLQTWGLGAGMKGFGLGNVRCTMNERFC